MLPMQFPRGNNKFQFAIMGAAIIMHLVLNILKEMLVLYKFNKHLNKKLR